MAYRIVGDAVVMVAAVLSGLSHATTDGKPWCWVCAVVGGVSGVVVVTVFHLVCDLRGGSK